jgi:hypothetical protein
MDTRSHDEIAASAGRDADLVRLRRAGQTFEAIGAELGFSRQYACRRYWELMKEPVLTAVADYRTEQLDRYDWLIREAAAVLARDHVTVSHGKVIRDEATGQPLLDDGPKLAAIRELRAIEAQRAELLGTKTPVKVEATGVSSVQVTYKGFNPEDV